MPGVLGIHAQRGGFHIKAGLLELGRNYFAAKVNGNFPENQERFGLPTIQGVIALSDGENGRLLAVLDSTEITTMRTGAATALAAKYLARPDSRVATICGCGNQGRVQLRALRRVLPLHTVYAYDMAEDRAREFALELSAELGISVTAVSDLSRATRQSDICVTCTPSQCGFLRRDDVMPGTFVAAVGADSPLKQELEPELMAASRIVVDVLEQCATMGDLHHAIEAGVVCISDVHAALGEVIAGKKSGRLGSEEIIVFDSTGMALQDVATAAIAYEKATRVKCGVSIDFAA
jgi:ornithine cyclodeaminase/alanine dehydrogenase-like protein (mu-crystallin family)